MVVIHAGVAEMTYREIQVGMCVDVLVAVMVVFISRTREDSIFSLDFVD
jgi:hypothetical protein